MNENINFEESFELNALKSENNNNFSQKYQTKLIELNKSIDLLQSQVILQSIIYSFIFH